MRVVFTCTVLALVVLLVLGCVPLTSEPAEEFMATYFRNVRRGDLDAVLQLYSNSFYVQTPRSEWEQTLQRAGERLGQLGTTRLVAWRATRMTGGSSSGTTYLLTYMSNYASGQVREEFQVFCPASSDTMRIQAHRMSSDVLAQ